MPADDKALYAQIPRVNGKRVTREYLLSEAKRLGKRLSLRNEPDFASVRWCWWFVAKVLPHSYRQAWWLGARALNEHYLQSDRKWVTYNQEKRILLARLMALL